MIEYTPGDIILVGSGSFLSKQIKAYMKAYNKKLGYPKIGDYYSHAAMIVDMWGRLYVAEALKDGITLAPLDDTYLNKLQTDTVNIRVLTPKKAYSKTEQEEVSKIAAAFALTPTRYDFLNLWYQIKMIQETTKTDENGEKWIGPKGNRAEKRLYCTEAVATWANRVRPDTFKAPWATNPVDVELNKYYKVKYPSTDGTNS
jgi:hypothetical protein